MGSRCVPNWVWAVLGLLHAAGFAWTLHSGRWNFPDSERYRQAAVNLVEQRQLYARPWPASAPHGQAVQEFTIRPFGYPVVLACLGSDQKCPWLVLLVQGCISFSILGWLLNWWARVAIPLPRHWLGAMGLIVGFPAQVVYANAVMSELWLQVTLFVVVTNILFQYKTGRERYGWGAAVAIVAALLLKPVCYPLALVWLVGEGWVAWKHRRTSLVLAALLPLVVVISYMRWNEQRTGYFHFSSIAEINLLHYNAAGVVRRLQGVQVEEAWVARVLRTANARTDFATRQRFIQRQADSVLLAHPFVYAGQHLLGMGTLLLDPGRFDICEFLGLSLLPGGGLLALVRAEGWLHALRHLPMGLLLLLTGLTVGNGVRLGMAINGLRRLRHGPSHWRLAGWLAVGIIGYLALLTGPLGAARFLVPAWPLLLGLALLGLRGPRRQTARSAAATANA